MFRTERCILRIAVRQGTIKVQRKRRPTGSPGDGRRAALHGTRGTSQGVQNPGNLSRKGRVIDMRAWKTRRRIDRMRSRNWRSDVLLWATIALTSAACVFAIAGCVPFWGQSHGILFSWFFAVLGAAAGSVLFAFGHRLARRLLFVDVLCMGISLVCALLVNANLMP